MESITEFLPIRYIPTNWHRIQWMLVLAIAIVGGCIAVGAGAWAWQLWLRTSKTAAVTVWLGCGTLLLLLWWGMKKSRRYYRIMQLRYQRLQNTREPFGMWITREQFKLVEPLTYPNRILQCSVKDIQDIQLRYKNGIEQIVLVTTQETIRVFPHLFEKEQPGEQWVQYLRQRLGV